MKSLLLLPILAWAGQAAAAVEPDRQLLDLLENRCADCHHDDQEPELSKATILSDLRNNPKYVSAGAPENSPLFKSLMLPVRDKKRMPKSTAKAPRDPLPPHEIEIVRKWIAGPDPGSAASARPFITDGTVAQWIEKDLAASRDKLGAKPEFRYLSLTNLYNETRNGQPLNDEAAMKAFEAGVNKLLNSLSWKEEIYLATPIDPHRTVLRIDLGAIGLSPALWKRIALSYPYRVDRTGSTLETLTRSTGTLPVMRADYFAFICSQPPIYHEAMRLPGETHALDADLELEKNRLGIVSTRDIQKPEVVRAGFQKSGVSQGNRLIERFPRPNGEYYWRSYDFNPDRQNRRGGDLFKAPLGPIRASLTKNPDLAFSHDGGELIFSLPNGLQGYMLVDAKGARLDEAPLNVVTDKSRKDSRIVNGISCIRCHNAGVFTAGFKDEVLEASKHLDLAPEDRRTVARLHDQSRLETFFASDAARFETALEKCGTSTGTEEPVGRLYYHFRNDLEIGQLAAEINTAAPEAMSILEESKVGEIEAVLAKFKSGTPVPRPDFERAFPMMVRTLGLGTVPPTDPIAYVEFGNNIDVTKTNTGEGTAGLTVTGAPDKKQKPIRIGRPGEDEDADPPDPAGGSIKVLPGKPTGAARKPVRIVEDGAAQPESATRGSDGKPAPSPNPPRATPKRVKLPDYNDETKPATPAEKPTPPAEKPAAPPANPSGKPVKLG